VKTNEMSARPSRNPNESGQAIVLVAIVMIALLAAAGMAIDGGGLYFLYRDARNATDSAALAAAYTLCTNPDADWQGTGRFSAQESGFIDGVDGVEVNIGHPTIDEIPPGRGVEEYVEVQIVAPKTSYFNQVVYPEALQVDVNTIAYCNPGAAETEGGETRDEYAIYSRIPPGTCTSGERAIHVAGSGWEIYGDIWMNDNMNGAGAGGANNVNNANRVFGEVTVVSEINNIHIEHLLEEAPGDGTVSVGEEPANTDNRLPWNDWMELAPGGALEQAIGSAYHHISRDMCEGNTKARNKTFQDAGWLDENDRFEDGVYYIDCDVTQIQSGRYTGTITIITPGSIEVSSPSVQLEAWGAHPLIENALFITSWSTSIHPSSCSTANHAIRISGNAHTFDGDMYVTGYGNVYLDAPQSYYDTCFNVWGIRLNGAKQTIRCQPDGLPASSPSIGILD